LSFLARARRAAGAAVVLALALGLVAAGAQDAGAAKKKKKSSSARKKPQGPPPAPVAQSLRVYTGPNSTRLVLDLSRSATFRIEPDSLARTFAIVVPKAVRSPALDLAPLDDGAVTSLAGDETSEGFRLVLGVAEWYAPRVFGLEGETGQSARIVVDVVRPGQAERDRAERERVDRAVSTARRIVVIDPGHGGEAVGAVGPKRTYEKDVTLAIARRLAGELESHAGIQVVLTRSGDYDVPLRERYRVAERYQADAFISIHCNSARGTKGGGTEVYFLSLQSASDEASKALADLENDADRVSAGPGASTDDDLAGILFDLKQTESVQQSSVLAEAILSEIESGRRLDSRGVKQAGFAVLKSPVVPAVLVETAFINNPSEERLLRDTGFQQEMAEQIARGVLSYLEHAPTVARGDRVGRTAPAPDPVPTSTPANLGVAR